MTPRSEEGCVWTEAELWDVWTDVDCNDGHLLIDRSITPAGHGAEARGGTRIIPTPSFTQHSLSNAVIWIGLY
ncbi:hypothetical protein QQF64_035165 [Cirrhinus molitorella]|uniref:Uncharacterized protein n=1 Tax=Cirrhinus molitorella TaxID=172907 RepID=A0ABR3NFA8_9TELE